MEEAQAFYEKSEVFSLQRWLLRKYPALQEISGFAFSVNQSHQEEESMFKNDYS